MSDTNKYGGVDSTMPTELTEAHAEIRRLRNIICLLEDSRIRSLSVTDRPQLFIDILENGHLPDFEEVIE